VTKTNNKFNVNSNRGEDVDFISFGSFFNAYVRSTLEGVSGLCSHQFVRSTAFNKPIKGKVLPRPRINCRNKKKHAKSCAKKGLNGDAKRNCIFDLCAKFPKDLEKRIIKWNKTENKKKPKPIVPIKRVTCDLYADPHARSFDGKYFEAQTVGDWVLHRGPTIRAHYRGKSFGRWVGVVEWIVKVRGDVVRNVGFTGVTVNGEAVTLVNGQAFNLPNGGSVTKTGNKFNINSNRGEDVDFVSFGSFFNAYVRSTLPDVSGLCSHQFVKSVAFGHPQAGHRVPAPKINCANKANHVATCAAKGLNGMARTNCVFDLCAKFPKAIEARIIQLNRRENRRRK